MSILESELLEKKQRSSVVTSSKSKKSGRNKGINHVSSSLKSDRNSTTNLNDITGEQIDVDSVYGSHKWTIISD
jgi:hypothetical protein